MRFLFALVLLSACGPVSSDFAISADGVEYGEAVVECKERNGVVSVDVGREDVIASAEVLLTAGGSNDAPFGRDGGLLVLANCYEGASYRFRWIAPN